MPDFDTRRIFDRWARIRRENDRIDKIDGATQPFFHSELRRNMFSLHCARRNTHLQLPRITSCSGMHAGTLTCHCSCRCVFLRTPQASKNSKSEESSRRKNFSDMLQTFIKHATYYSNIISSALECAWYVSHVLFENQFWSQCPREISTTKNTISHESDMLTEQEQVLWGRKEVLFQCAMRFGLHRVMNFGP